MGLAGSKPAERIIVFRSFRRHPALIEFASSTQSARDYIAFGTLIIPPYLDDSFSFTHRGSRFSVRLISVAKGL